MSCSRRLQIAGNVVRLVYRAKATGITDGGVYSAFEVVGKISVNFSI
jgi:hypothetical protein